MFQIEHLLFVRSVEWRKGIPFCTATELGGFAVAEHAPNQWHAWVLGQPASAVVCKPSLVGSIGGDSRSPDAGIAVSRADGSSIRTSSTDAVIWAAENRTVTVVDGLPKSQRIPCF